MSLLTEVKFDFSTRISLSPLLELWLIGRNPGVTVQIDSKTTSTQNVYFSVRNDHANCLYLLWKRKEKMCVCPSRSILFIFILLTFFSLSLSFQGHNQEIQLSFLLNWCCAPSISSAKLDHHNILRRLDTRHKQIHTNLSQEVVPCVFVSLSSSSSELDLGGWIYSVEVMVVGGGRHRSEHHRWKKNNEHWN